MIRKSARIVRPHIAIVLAVANTHTNNFRSLDETAKEKSQILQAVSKKGLAILNGEDPRVRNMSSTCPCDTKMFGLSNDLDLWADEISSEWPDRLSLRLHTTSENECIRTRLIGEHWVNTVLACALTANACGISLKEIAAGFEKIHPFRARMQAVYVPAGAIILRDEGNASPETMQAAFKVLRESTAMRKVMVMSDVSDSNERPRERMKKLGTLASTMVDLVVFVGEHAHHAAKAALKSGMSQDRVCEFPDVFGAAQFLKSELRSGDLVLLKGRNSDHLSRIAFAQFGSIGCWKNRCSKRYLCDTCDKLKPDFDLSTIHGN
jgi:UDP-N-acetylmuramoyl-tripeptide--D-alanyl-D-alanine ligase